MKKYLLLTMCFLFINCTDKLQSVINKPDIIIVDYVSMDILTFALVRCDYFERAFGSTIKSFTIKDSLEISSIVSILESLPKATSNSEPDTRIKLRLYGKESTQEICISRFYVMINHRVYLYSDDLKTILNYYITDNSQ